MPVIEDDVYSELHAENDSVYPLRMFDDTGNTMLCSSFSKSLIAGLRIGWVAAGKRALEVQKLQLMSTLATSAPVQMTLVHYLTSRNYESHLKQLRKKLFERKSKMTVLLSELLPEAVKVLSQSGGYFIWLELPKHIDALPIYREALKGNISIAPGKMFSLTEQYDHCIRLNASFELNAKYVHALNLLANIIRDHLAK
ncbi:transcriptional regulator, GntR family [Vibrio sp. JCM 19053]|nr:transcriptional regulator, GntR family [Vibrio sp. JCM 19053]